MSNVHTFFLLIIVDIMYLIVIAVIAATMPRNQNQIMYLYIRCNNKDLKA